VLDPEHSLRGKRDKLDPIRTDRSSRSGMRDSGHETLRTRWRCGGRPLRPVSYDLSLSHFFPYGSFCRVIPADGAIPYQWHYDSVSGPDAGANNFAALLFPTLTYNRCAYAHILTPRLFNDVTEYEPTRRNVRRRVHNR